MKVHFTDKQIGDATRVLRSALEDERRSTSEFSTRSLLGRLFHVLNIEPVPLDELATTISGPCACGETNPPLLPAHSYTLCDEPQSE